MALGYTLAAGVHLSGSVAMIARLDGPAETGALPRTAQKARDWIRDQDFERTVRDL